MPNLTFVCGECSRLIDVKSISQHSKFGWLSGQYEGMVLELSRAWLLEGEGGLWVFERTPYLADMALRGGCDK